MCSDLGRADKGNRLDIGVVADQVDRLHTAVNHVEYARWNAGFHRQFCKAHRDHWVLLGGLKDEGIAGSDSHWKHPQRDHRGEVEWGNTCADAQRLQQGVGVHTAGHVIGQFTQLQVADAGGMLDYFQAAKHIPLCIRQCFALFGRENRRQFLHVFADQLLVLEEHSGAGADWRFAPSLEGFLGAGHGGVHFVGGGKGHSG
ncbi:hypothetical protein D3C81_899750 [compost metagenome]